MRSGDIAAFLVPGEVKMRMVFCKLQRIVSHIEPCVLRESCQPNDTRLNSRG